VRRVGLVLVMMALTLIAGSGVAVAAVTFGTDGRDFLVGTNGADQFFGNGGGDGLVGRADDDVLFGGPGNDFIWSWDFAGRKPHRDVVHCGGGRDEVMADRLDRLFDCEKVERVGRR
jgi:Ca2+-binding RTX toxin-like protein